MNNSSNGSLSLPEAWADYAVPDYTAYTTLAVCGLILGVGLFGNLLVVIVVALTGRVVRSSTNLFLVNLSVAYLLLLVTSTPTAIVELAIRRDDWIWGKVSYVVTVNYLLETPNICHAHH